MEEITMLPIQYFCRIYSHDNHTYFGLIQLSRQINYAILTLISRAYFGRKRIPSPQPQATVVVANVDVVLSTNEKHCGTIIVSMYYVV